MYLAVPNYRATIATYLVSKTGFKQHVVLLELHLVIVQKLRQRQYDAMSVTDRISFKRRLFTSSQRHCFSITAPVLFSYFTMKQSDLALGAAKQFPHMGETISAPNYNDEIRNYGYRLGGGGGRNTIM